MAALMHREELGLNIGRGAHLRSSPIGHGYAFADHATVAGATKRYVQGVDGIPAPPRAVGREEDASLACNT